jgi:hypothetical protein
LQASSYYRGALGKFKPASPTVADAPPRGGRDQGPHGSSSGGPQGTGGGSSGDKGVHGGQRGPSGEEDLEVYSQGQLQRHMIAEQDQMLGDIELQVGR